MILHPRLNPNIFANNPLDRAAHRRADPDWQAAALAAPEARMVIFHDLKVLLNAGHAQDPEPDGAQPPMQSVKWMKGAARILFEPDAPLVFLGLLGSVPYFALAAPKDFDAEASPLAGRFTEVRSAAMGLSPEEAAIVGQARWLLDWHARHGFCARCGAPTLMTEAGWKRACPACMAEHFPRVDPVAIMLALREDKCLLGRQKMFPAGMYSALAGFVEPGETVEEACVRELSEEAGIKARAENVRYLFAQPWPFPSSLMFGLHVQADSAAITVDALELEDARWFTRAQAQSMRSGGLQTGDGVLFAPAQVAVARKLLDAWLDGEA